MPTRRAVSARTTNVNLSACLFALREKGADNRYRSPGNTTSGLGIDKNQIRTSIYDVMINGAPIKDTIHHTDYDNLDIIVSKIN